MVSMPQVASTMVGHINLGVSKGGSTSGTGTGSSTVGGKHHQVNAATMNPTSGNSHKRGSLAHSSAATITNQSFSYSVVQGGGAGASGHLRQGGGGAGGHHLGYSTRKLINETKTMMTNPASGGQPPQHMGTSILLSQTSNLSTGQPTPSASQLHQQQTMVQQVTTPNLTKILLQNHQRTATTTKAKQQLSTSQQSATSSPPNHKNSSRPTDSHNSSKQTNNNNSNSSRNNSTRLQSQKSGASLLQTSLSQVVTTAPTPSINSNRSLHHNHKRHNWISPRNQQPQSSNASNNNSAFKHHNNQQKANNNSNSNEGPHNHHHLEQQQQQQQQSQQQSQLSEEIRSVKLDLPNQNVVRADTDRARFIKAEHREAMQALLTYYCKAEGLGYKQGINDVMAPFVWLAFNNHAVAVQQHQAASVSTTTTTTTTSTTAGKKNTQKPRTASKKSKQVHSQQQQPLHSSFNSANSKHHQQQQASSSSQQTSSGGPGLVDLEEPFVMVREFIRTFQTNLFGDDDFHALQACLCLLKMLLTYHDPELFRHLERNNVIPEMYSIPWFITYFASRVTQVEVILELWDRCSTTQQQHSTQKAGCGRGDPTFIFFFAVALIVNSRERIIRSDQADLPSTMAELSIDSKDELRQLIKLAEEIEDNTPYSFKQLDEIKTLFLRGKQAPETLSRVSISLEQTCIMPLLPAELFFYSFPGEIECPNPECANSLTWRKNKTGEYAPLIEQIPQSLRHTLVVLPHQQSESGGIKHHKTTPSSSPVVLIDSATSSQSSSVVVNPGGGGSDASEQLVIKSGLSSFTNNSSSANSFQVISSHHNMVNMNKMMAPPNSGGGPLETESNLNYADDHQESPIDLINETAKMKHLSQEDFKTYEQQQQQLQYNNNNNNANTNATNSTIMSNNRQQFINNSNSSSSAEITNYSYNQSNTAAAAAKKNQLLLMPELCWKCIQRQKVQLQLDSGDGGKRPAATATGGAEAAVDLSTDLLYSKFRFIIVDCRLNTLQQEVTLPHCLTVEVLAASQAEQLKNQIKSLLDYKDSYHICLLGLDHKAASSSSEESSAFGKISIRQFHEAVLRFLSVELVSQGFKYVSTLPGGFQQVHDLAHVYGFQLINHDDQEVVDQELHFLGEGSNHQCVQDEAAVSSSLGNTAPTNQATKTHGPLKHKGSFSEASALDNIGGGGDHATTSSLRLSALDSQSITVSLSGTGGPPPASQLQAPTTAQTSLQKQPSMIKCYHCMVRSGTKCNKQQLLMVNTWLDVEQQDMAATINTSKSSLQQPIGGLHSKDEKQFKKDAGGDEKLTVHNINSQELAPDGGAPYQSQKFDLIDFSDYLPFGLKHVYGAFNGLNQMLQQQQQHQQTQQTGTPAGGIGAVGGSGANSLEETKNEMGGSNALSVGPVAGSAIRKQSGCSAGAGDTNGEKKQLLMMSGNGRRAAPSTTSGGLVGEDHSSRISDISRSRYRQININPSSTVMVPRQQSTESAYIGGSKASQYSLTSGSAAAGANASMQGMTRSAGKSSGSTCRKTATYQNQQHLQLQSKFKLMSKVPDFQSNFLVQKEHSSGGGADFERAQKHHAPITSSGTGAHGAGQQASPVRRNRPRITNEVQSHDKDIAMQLQQQYRNSSSNNCTGIEGGPQSAQHHHQHQIIDDKSRSMQSHNHHQQQQRQEVASQSSHLSSSTINRSGLAGGAGASTISSYMGSQASESQGGASGAGGAGTTSATSATSDQSLPVYLPTEESYMLNGIVTQRPIDETDYTELLSSYHKGHLFTATRLPARKRTFQFRSQLSFNLQIVSKILITPFTVAILQKTDDIRLAADQNYQRHQQQQNQNQQSSTTRCESLNTSVSSSAQQPHEMVDQIIVRRPDGSQPYAMLQSRFFMYDLIKITSRKSTTKIITFYYRIPKKSEYDERVLEPPDQKMLQSLNSKPQCSYQFAFKRAEFEEVSMSFEFEREEEAKECINSVSNLYKQLKESSKKQSRRGQQQAASGSAAQSTHHHHHQASRQSQQQQQQQKQQQQTQLQEQLQQKTSNNGPTAGATTGQI